MGHVGRNIENVGRGTHQFSAPNHGEEGVVEQGQDVGDTGGGGSMGSSGDEISNHLHWSQKGDGGSVGGAVPYLQSLIKKEGLRGGGGGCRRDPW